ncbi:DUF5677 domain-containing protein [Alistipes sp. ZOR0009]|uniref:DUF5677 domain-containing protein n=1 Tax=Alistipes sp. ZOR0009 TaxID=1339253 RepID=UPI000648E07C|nr:DUF5677 domain-containing protein [Alistipes sp. ZOR0009]
MERPYYIENLIQDRIDKERSKYQGTSEEFEKEFNKKIPELIKSITGGLAETIFEYCVGEENDLKKRELEIVDKIESKYKTGLTLFEGFIELNSKISSITYDKFYKIFDTYEDHQKLDTLISNHVRACQIANEIKVLVSNGFADGAFARWRTLHEICVVFLYLYDSSYEIIEMYNDYAVIEEYRKAISYNECSDFFDWEPISEKELNQLSLNKEELISKYGKDFQKSYGWTMRSLPNGKRNFKELENLVAKDNLRAVYTWSNESIHAGVSGINTKLSLRDEEQNNFLTGPNDCGFLDPIQYATDSLYEMSSVLLGMEDSILNKVLVELLVFFQNEIVKEFDRIENE